MSDNQQLIDRLVDLTDRYEIAFKEMTEIVTEIQGIPEEDLHLLPEDAQKAIRSIKEQEWKPLFQ